ncbi:MAG: hypothetical protein P8N09_00210 [Planctomycetota bacterium]|nr:hypothetical protein [Planctomycetota bacterium]
MFAFRTLPAVTAIMSLSLTGLLAPEASAKPQDVTASADHYILEFDEQNGEKLVDVLEMFRGVLDVPLTYQRSEIDSVSVFIKGPVSVARADMRDMLDALLEPLGFVSWDAEEGKPPLISVARRVSGTPPMHWPNQIVPLESLDKQPERRTVFYTVVIPLTHVDARNGLSTFNPYLNYDGENLRAVENSNCMIIKSYSLRTLREVRDMVKLIDIDSDESMNLRKEINSLKKDLQQLKGKSA